MRRLRGTLAAAPALRAPLPTRQQDHHTPPRRSTVSACQASRVMPPLTGGAERSAPRVTGFCIDEWSEGGHSRSASLAPWSMVPERHHLFRLAWQSTLVVGHACLKLPGCLMSLPAPSGPADDHRASVPGRAPQQSRHPPRHSRDRASSPRHTPEKAALSRESSQPVP